MSQNNQQSNIITPNANAGRWLVCAPTHFDVLYEINPWMDLDVKPNITRTQAQWATLETTLKALGCKLEYVTPVKGLPDMVYTANAGLVRGDVVVLSTFKHAERQGEATHFHEWYEKNGFSVKLVSRGAFEGEGDALFAGDKLFCACGFRSDFAAYEEVAQFLNVHTYIIGELTDPRLYHLDTCFCPLDKNRAYFYPGAFTAESIKKFEKEIELIAIPEVDALRFACNAVVLGKDIVMPAGCDHTMKMVQKFGFTPHPLELDEFMKGGGSAKCLTNKLFN